MAEGIPAGLGNTPENYKEELFIKKLGFGSRACPFDPPYSSHEVDYSQVRCPVAAEQGAKSFRLKIHPTAGEREMDDIARAVEKVTRAYLK